MTGNHGGDDRSDLRRAASDLAVAGSPGRVILLLALLDFGEASAGTLCAATGQSPYAGSFHLTRLSAAGLVHRRRSGKFILLTLSPRGRQIAGAARAAAGIAIG